MLTMLQHNIEQAIGVLGSLADLESEVAAASRLVGGALKGGHKLLACGNGGSAADAAHLTTEFVCRFSHDRRPYPAICLAANGGDITAIANDYIFDEVFARQVDAFAQPGDVLIAFTTSGNSKNIRLVLERARRREIDSIAFLGKAGGCCVGIANVELLVRHENTARIQEGHKLLLHTICEMVEPELNG